jgi:microcystin-dependent protein
MAAIAAAAAGCGKDEVDYIVVKNQRSKAPIAGAVLKASNGAASAASGADGVVTLSVRVDDNLVYTLEAPNFPAKVVPGTSITTGGSYFLNELGAKSSGILLYTDASGNTRPAPAGTVLKVNLNDNDFVQNLYETTVTADGAYEFTLPENVNGNIVSPVEIDGMKYSVSRSVGSATILWSVSSEPITAWYFSSAPSPFALVMEYPARVANNGAIVFQFNKKVDRSAEHHLNFMGRDVINPSYTNARYTIGGQITVAWSDDDKTLTLTPATTWTNASTSLQGYSSTSYPITWYVSTEADANGNRQYSRTPEYYDSSNNSWNTNPLNINITQ